MASITVSARSGAPEETAADTRVVGVFEGDSLADPALQRLIELGEAKRALKKVAVAHEDAPGGGQRRVLIAGLGPRDEFGAEQAPPPARATSSAPSRLASRPRPRRHARRSSVRCRSRGPLPAARAWPVRSWRARS